MRHNLSLRVSPGPIVFCEGVAGCSARSRGSGSAFVTAARRLLLNGYKCQRF
jgi:hypothetical protein